MTTVTDTDLGVEHGSASGNIRGTVTHTEVDEAKLEKRNEGLRAYAEDAHYESRFTAGRLINGMFTAPIDLPPGETRHGIIRFEGKIRRRAFTFELPIGDRVFQFDVTKSDSPGRTNAWQAA